MRIHSSTRVAKKPQKASVIPQPADHFRAMAMPAKHNAEAINWHQRMPCVGG